MGRTIITVQHSYMLIRLSIQLCALAQLSIVILHIEMSIIRYYRVQIVVDLVQLEITEQSQLNKYIHVAEGVNQKQQNQQNETHFQHIISIANSN
jgi:hypothetical protein